MKVKIKKLHPNSVLPKYAKIGDAGMDLTAISEEWSEDKSMVTYDTGIAIEIPEGYVGLLFPRSSVYKTTLNLANSVGVIDSGYRGSIMFKFRYLEEGMVYDIGDRVGQIIILPYPQVEFEEVEDLSSTDRGEGGFGSTNKPSISNVKKALYKEKPVAKQVAGDVEFKYYRANLSDGTLVGFKVPQEESQDFAQEMEAQLLIRWLTN